MNSDAVAINSGTVPKMMLSTNIHPNVMQEISQNLSHTDIKKMYFLCLDLIPAATECPITIEEILSLINGDIDLVGLVKELLYHIKKYKLLKSLETCKHHMEITLRDKMFVKEDRLSLFYVCENLENDCVERLKCLLRQNSPVTKDWEDVAAEDFLSAWLRNIDDFKMQLLKEKLEEMHYNQLATRLNSEVLSYPVVAPARGKPCGLAVIFNNETFNKPLRQMVKNKHVPMLTTREGSKADEERLCWLWNSYGFDVIVFNDKTYCSMMEIIVQLVKLNYSKYNIFISCILSHGDKGEVYTSDNVAVNLCDEIIYKFNSRDVPLLNKKPKLFFIQACQGERLENAAAASDTSLQTDAASANVYYNTSSMRDMVWVSSVIPSHISFRDTERGSWFINSLVDIFDKYGTMKDVSQLINLVNNDVSKKTGEFEGNVMVTQMPAATSTTFGTLRLKRVEGNSTISLRSVVNLWNCPEHLQPLFQLADAIYCL